MDGDDDFDEAIDTLATTVALRDGVLHIRSKGVMSTDASVTETIAAAIRLGGGKRHPVLFDARLWPGGDPRGWMSVINQMRTAFNAGAMIVDPGSFEALSERFAAFGQLLRLHVQLGDGEIGGRFLLGGSARGERGDQQQTPGQGPGRVSHGLLRTRVPRARAAQKSAAPTLPGGGRDSFRDRAERL